MPAAFDRMVRKVWGTMKGKKNPRSGNPFTESDAYAVATTAWKKAHGGRAPGRESLKDWRILEFIMPINESRTVGDDFLVTGIAINETTTRNGIKYTVDELENAASSFRSKPILLDHENKVKNIVGRTTENVNFNHEKRGIEFEARIVDKDIREKINQGLITDVSIGASVKDLVEEDDGSRRAVGLEGMEISFVAIPGDPNANLAQAMDNGFLLKEQMEMSESFIDDLDLDNEEKLSITINKLNGGIKMVEEEEKQEEVPEEKEEEEKKEEATEEKVNKTEINVDMSAVTEAIKSLKSEIAELKDIKVKEQPSADEPEKPDAEDETKGEIAKEEPEEPKTEESFVVEQAESGRGFAMYRDYSKENPAETKLKRLIR